MPSRKSRTRSIFLKIEYLNGNLTPHNASYFHGVDHPLETPDVSSCSGSPFQVVPFRVFTGAASLKQCKPSALG